MTFPFRRAEITAKSKSLLVEPVGALNCSDVLAVAVLVLVSRIVGAAACAVAHGPAQPSIRINSIYRSAHRAAPGLLFVRIIFITLAKFSRIGGNNKKLNDF